MQKVFAIITLLVFMIPHLFWACLWDYDTLAMERERFPEAQELVAGHFLRHSPHYYQWRLSDRHQKPIEQWSPADFDDVAVAYDKLGEHDTAISTIEDKMARFPDEGRYESEANLGTFLVHAGRLNEGTSHIDAAIAINPEAHFGREIFQALLVKYLIAKRSEKQSEGNDHQSELPLNQSDGPGFVASGFVDFVLKARETTDHQESDEIRDATKGVLGMMRFGNHESPILLEALGDLLAGKITSDDAKMLGARAYLKASYHVESPIAVAAYRKKAEQAMNLQLGRKLEDVESELQKEIEQGNSFFQEISDDELAWAAAGKNLDEEFAKKYYQAPPLELLSPHLRVLKPVEKAIYIGIAFLVGSIVIVTGLAFIIRKLITRG